MRLFSLAPHLSKQTLSLQEIRSPAAQGLKAAWSISSSILSPCSYAAHLYTAAGETGQTGNGVKRPLISGWLERGREEGEVTGLQPVARGLPFLSALLLTVSRNDSVESPTQSAWSDQRDSAALNAYYALMDLILINTMTSSGRVSDLHLSCSTVKITFGCFFVKRACYCIRWIYIVKKMHCECAYNIN